MTERRVDPERVARARAADLPGLVGSLVRLRRRGREYAGLCPFHSERTPSFAVYRNRSGAWVYHCFGCGAHGDAIDWVAHWEGLSFRAAVDRLLGDGGADDDREAPARPRPAPARVAPARDDAPDRWARAVRVLQASRPAAETVVETYLRQARGIDLALAGWPIPSLRHHPGLDYWYVPPDDPALRQAPLRQTPLRQAQGEGRRAGGGRPVKIGTWPAMVGVIQGPDGRRIGAHVTYLAPDGSGKAEPVCPVTGEVLSAKKILGAQRRGAIRLAPPADPDAGGSGRWAAAEGIESALSVLVAERAAGRDTAVWAGLSLGNLAGGAVGKGPRHPRPRRRGDRLPSAEPDPDRPGLVPPVWATVAVLAADGDGRDPDSQRRLEARALARWRACGVDAVQAKPPKGRDFNDFLTPEDAHGG